MHLPARFLAGLGQRLQEILPVNIIHENILAPVSPVYDVVNDVRILHSHRARHGPMMPNSPLTATTIRMQPPGLTPFQTNAVTGPTLSITNAVNGAVPALLLRGAVN